jgi:predicted NUDIX family NTP pyrophosphohydrolase
VLLTRPGGPYGKSPHFGSWSLPKGIADEGEAIEAPGDLLATTAARG